MTGRYDTSRAATHSASHTRSFEVTISLFGEPSRAPASPLSTTHRCYANTAPVPFHPLDILLLPAACSEHPTWPIGGHETVTENCVLDILRPSCGARMTTPDIFLFTPSDMRTTRLLGRCPRRPENAQNLEDYQYRPVRIAAPLTAGRRPLSAPMSALRNIQRPACETARGAT